MKRSIGNGFFSADLRVLVFNQKQGKGLYLVEKRIVEQAKVRQKHRFNRVLLQPAGLHHELQQQMGGDLPLAKAQLGPRGPTKVRNMQAADGAVTSGPRHEERPALLPLRELPHSQVSPRRQLPGEYAQFHAAVLASGVFLLRQGIRARTRA